MHEVHDLSKRSGNEYEDLECWDTNEEEDTCEEGPPDKKEYDEGLSALRGTKQLKQSLVVRIDLAHVHSRFALETLVESECQTDAYS